MSPKPPGGLHAAGLALWREIVADVQVGWELDCRDLTHLTLACRAADRAAELDQLVVEQGLTVTGSTGQEKLHPAISECRLQRQQVALLLDRVELSPPNVRTHTPRRELHRVDHGQAG